ncbi:MAG: adenine deaminase [Bdellovibrio sp.]|nr:adenine deaminase [Bdellovibrio sp.]
MLNKKISLEKLQKHIDAAVGKISCDLILRDVQYLDVFSCTWKTGDLSIVDGTIVGLEPGLKAKREIQGRNYYLVPGFIDAHVHVESSMMLPHYFEKAVMPRGTTTAICDPHEIANVIGLEGLRFFLNASELLQMDLFVMLSSCVPATHLETNGGGILNAKELWSLANHPRALGLAEVMNFPGVINAQKEVLEKIEAFSPMPIDGHCPMLRGLELSAYASSGISSCHESSELEEAKEKLTKGMDIWIREGSVAKDLRALLPLIKMATSTSIGFCTDDRNPFDIATEGHVDYLVRESIRGGVLPEIAYRVASWGVARHYRLNTGVDCIGAIAPGYQADFAVLGDPKTCEIIDVYKRGQSVNEMGFSKVPYYSAKNTICALLPNPEQLKGPSGQVNVIGVLEGKILTSHEVLSSESPRVARLSVLERHGHNSKPSNGYVTGFGENLKGAIASSVGHDSHNLIVVGKDLKEMRLALAVLAQSGGGFCVVGGENVMAHLPLPFGGLMSEKTPQALKKDIENLREASCHIGCVLKEPFLQLAFLSLPVIPKLKLTDKGLVDVEKFELIPVGI